MACFSTTTHLDSLFSLLKALGLHGYTVYLVYNKDDWKLLNGCNARLGHSVRLFIRVKRPNVIYSQYSSPGGLLRCWMESIKC